MSGMTVNRARISEAHRKELLGFLLVKTAAVRRGVKPAELLRVRHCYSGVNSEGLRVCLYRSDIYDILGLDYIELKVEVASSLVLFYNPGVLAATLAERRNRKWLARLGYPVDGTADELLEELRRRFSGSGMPHEDRRLHQAGFNAKGKLKGERKYNGKGTRNLRFDNRND